jgi:hypothetical protein
VMKLVLVGIFCGALGFLCAWFVAPGPYKYVFRSKVELVLTDPAGQRLGVLPVSTPLISTEELMPHEKLGWFACVPVYFGTMKEADGRVRSTRDRPTPLSTLLQINAIQASELPDQTVR